ncbi:MAG: methyltransferase domain-containing protein [Candidatus Saganbacteria bacterium]|nr:methyltransferase domain-containing protein [Candidatus Saganbacteria bacterium]
MLNETYTAKNIWNLSATSYHAYTKRFRMHANIATRLIAMAGLRVGEHVLDFGAGTGVATLKIAESVGNEGRVVAYDLSENMLKIAQQECKSHSNIVFVLAHSDEINEKLCNEKFSAAICSNSFFHIDSKEAFLKSLMGLSMPGFRMTFSLYETVFHDPEYIKGREQSDDFFSNILYCSRQRGFGNMQRQERYQRLDFNALLRLFEKYGLKLEKPQIEKMQRPFEDRVAFFKIPAILFEILPGIPLSEASMIINLASAMTKNRQVQNRRSYLFKASAI